MAVESIAKTLGAGSGIDLKSLVDGLVEAQFGPKKEALKKREEALEAQISKASELRQVVTQFDQALKTLVRGGELTSKLVSSSEASIKASFQTGVAPRDLSTSVTVKQIASAQVSTSNAILAPGAAFRAGSLTLRLGRDVVDASGTVVNFTPIGGAVTINIGAADRTLSGIAAKINAANAGVTATVITDGDGERLSIKGPLGADKAFELTGNDSGGGGGGGGGSQSLTTLNVSRASTTTTTGTRARDAVVMVDGVEFTRQTNSITDLVAGVKLDLVGPSTGPVAITAAKPSAALKNAVTDFVGAYNEMFALVKEADDAFNGTLRSDGAVDALKRNLQRLTTTPLATGGPAGAPTTLADIGVATARDGSLSVDSARLTKAMADFPAEVEALFAETTGLPAALGAVARQVTSRTSGLVASTATYKRRQADLADLMAKATDQETALRDRLTRQFATMDARTSAYKSTMAFMDNQIKAWNRSDA